MTPVPDTVQVRVRGAASRLSALAPGDLSMVVDLDGVRTGRRLFPLTPEQVTAPFGVEVTQVTPQSVPLVFETTATATVPSIEGASSLVREAVTIDTADMGLRLQGGATAVVTVTVAADTTERTLTGVPIAVRGGATGRLVPAEVAVTVQGAAEIVRGLTPADITLFVDVQGEAPGRELVVQSESSPRFVVRAIAPATIRYGRPGPGR
jgi:YbbR domain-containing protein